MIMIPLRYVPYCQDDFFKISGVFLCYGFLVEYQLQSSHPMTNSKW